MPQDWCILLLKPKTPNYKYVVHNAVFVNVWMLLELLFLLLKFLYTEFNNANEWFIWPISHILNILFNVRIWIAITSHCIEKTVLQINVTPNIFKCNLNIRFKNKTKRKYIYNRTLLNCFINRYEILLVKMRLCFTEMKTKCHKTKHLTLRGY